MKTVLLEVLTNPKARTETNLSAVAANNTDAFIPWSNVTGS